MDRLFDLVLWVVQTAFYYLFFTIWGWIILLLIVLPAVRKRLSTWGKRRRIVSPSWYATSCVRPSRVIVTLSGIAESVGATSRGAC